MQVARGFFARRHAHGSQSIRPAAGGGPFAGLSRFALDVPALRVVSSFAAVARPGWPGPYPGRVVAVTSTRASIRRRARQRRDRARDDGARMRTLTGRHDARRVAPLLLRQRTSSASKSTAAGYPHCISAYDRRGGRAPSSRGSACRCRNLRLRAVSESGGDATYAPHLPKGVQIVAAERANCYADTAATIRHLPRAISRGRGHAVHVMRLVSRQLTRDHQHPEHEGHGATGRHGVSEEHRVRQLLQRGAHPPARQVHTIPSSAAGVDRAAGSRTVLQNMDGLRGVWHGGPFARTTRYVSIPSKSCSAPIRWDRSAAADIIEKERARTARSPSGPIAQR